MNPVGPSVLAQAHRAEALGRVDFSKSFLSFIWSTSNGHQIWLAVISVVVFLMTTAPLEIQRRVVNGAFKGGDYQAILGLSALYIAIAFTGGVAKLALNVYSNWVGENAVRDLRLSIDKRVAIDRTKPDAAQAEGVEVSMIVAETEPVGQFVGSAISEPVMHGGLLLSILAYMAFLQPLMALLVFAVLSPQFIFVPWIQAAINKRTAQRIVVLRGISIAIVKTPEDSGNPRQRRRFDLAFDLNMEVYKLKFSMNFLMNLMRHLGVCGILALGGWYVVHGQTEVGTVVAFISGLSEINEPWGDLVNWFRDMKVASVKYRLIADAVENELAGAR